MFEWLADSVGGGFGDGVVCPDDLDWLGVAGSTGAEAVS